MGNRSLEVGTDVTLERTCCCGGKFNVVEVKGVPAVLHSMPACKPLQDLDDVGPYLTHQRCCPNGWSKGTQHLALIDPPLALLNLCAVRR